MDISTLNIWAAWAGVATGMASGALMGLRFHRSDWLGGYDAWSRRLVRLGHICFFGLALINFAFDYTVMRFDIVPPRPLLIDVAAWAFVIGAVLMPLVCYLAAWRRPWRHAFALPVGALLSGAVCLITWRVLS